MTSRLATGWWRNGAARDRDNRAVPLADVDRLYVDGAALDAALLRAWPAPSPSWPFLVVRELDDDDAVARATALLAAWPPGARGLELRAGSGRLPPLAAVPSAVTSLRLQADDGKRLDLTGLTPAREARRLELACVTGSIDLRPLRGDPSLTDVELHGKVKGADTVCSWPGLRRLQTGAAGGLEPFFGHSTPPSSLDEVSLQTMAAIDLAPLTRLPGLRRLELAGLKNEPGSLHSLADLRLLTLSLSGMAKLTDLTPLRGLDGVDDLRLANLKALRSLDGLLALPALHTLRVGGALAALVDVDAVAAHPRLHTLAFERLQTIRVVRALTRVALDRGLALVDEAGQPLS
jgi:hypothetical protein